MPIVEDGPIVEDEVDWGATERLLMAAILLDVLDDAFGPSVQKSGRFGETVALKDWVIGKVGPMVGKWDPERGSRMIQEF